MVVYLPGLWLSGLAEVGLTDGQTDVWFDVRGRQLQ